MDLFTYLMAKNDHNTSVNKDLFSYLLGKGQSGTYQEYTGTSLSINNTKKGKMAITLNGNTSQTGTPTPDSPQTIHSVSGDNTIKIEDVNLFDGFRELYTGSTYNNGKLIAQGTCRGNYLIPSGNRTYYFNYNVANSIRYYVAEYDANKNEIRSNPKYAPQSFTIGNDAIYFSIIFAFVSGTTYPVEISNLQLEYGNQATTYQPYQSQTYPINLPVGMELNKIGTYQDYFYKDSGKWYLHKEIGKVTFNGSEEWNKVGDVYRVRNTSAMELSPLLCNRYKYTTYGYNDYECNTTTTYYNINFRNSTITSVDNWKTEIASNNLILYYVLATPTDTEITDTTLIEQLDNIEKAMSYNGQTNISQVNDDLPFNLIVKVKVSS